MKTTLNSLRRENWQDVIPESENVFSVSSGSGYFFARYLVDAFSQVYQYNYSGDLVRKVELPELEHQVVSMEKRDQEELFFHFQIITL